MPGLMDSIKNTFGGGSDDDNDPPPAKTSNSAGGTSTTTTSDGKQRTGLMSSLKSSLGISQEEPEPEPPQPAEDESFFSDICPKMTFQQRLIGFCVCFGIGYLMTFASFRFFVRLIEGHPVPFALNYTVGNILALMASMFLCGPARQLKNMMDDKRKVTAIIYVSCLVATLTVVFLPLPGELKLPILLLLIITQLSASVWYNLSYIPFGRRTFCRCFKNLTGLDEDEGRV